MIGRRHEIEELNNLYIGNKSELVAVYGRRRVGKTYLIDETFKGKITFRHAGLSPAEENSSSSSLKTQLNHFYYSLKMQGMKKGHCPTSWFEAFFMLEQLLEQKDKGKRQVVFLDELPWMDTPRSNFITAFEGFWNTWGCHRNNLMVIVCGSANSWILNKLINNHGGLYNRVTYEIKLSPFSLCECEEFFKANNIALSRYDITQSYMILGGIPYYLGYFQKGLSLSQNIDLIFFSNKAKLYDEYERLFASVFSNPSVMKVIVKELSTRNIGLTRKELSERCKITDGGTLSNALNALISSDFVIKYVPFGLKKNQEHYKLIDPFCLFYLHFVEHQNFLNESFWQQNVTSQEIISWRGYSFENVCFNHISQIKTALGINGVITTQSAWSKRSNDDDSTQIDLIIERKDNVINMCEIKFYNDIFTLNKEYHQTLIHRQGILSNEVSPRFVIHNSLITTFGLKYNEYSGDFVSTITLEDLFRY